MKRLRALACGFLLALCAAPVLAVAQEPSGVVGYIAFIDPQTGQRWIPKGETGALQGYPREISVAGGGPRQIQFHFDRWRYDRVEAGPWRLFSGGRETPVPLTRRASPFPDLH